MGTHRSLTPSVTVYTDPPGLKASPSLLLHSRRQRRWACPCLYSRQKAGLFKMAKNLFSVPIFFVLFRESLEASIIISVLLALVEQLVRPRHVNSKDANSLSKSQSTTLNGQDSTESSSADGTATDARSESERRLLRKLRIQIFAGAATGLFLALAIGAAFIVVFYVKVTDLYSQTEDLWEGVFSLIAALMIWTMGLTMLRMDRAKVKWRIKLQKAFERNGDIQAISDGNPEGKIKESRSSKYALFLLPFFTVLREGLEAVVFVGGVSLGQEGSSIPIAAIVGLIAGLIVGYLLYKSSSRLNMSIFLVGSTAFLLLIGAGLMAKTVGYFQTYQFAKLVGADVAESGDGPGSYSVHGVVWHLNCCNPENKTSGGGWSIFNAILGWTNNATVGTILSYVFYWLSIIAALVYMKWQEGRLTKKQREAGAAKRAAAQRDDHDGAAGEKAKDDGSSETHSHEPGAQVIGGSELR